jgi:hypothetical protein
LSYGAGVDTVKEYYTMSSRRVLALWVLVLVSLLGSMAVSADGEAGAITRNVVFRVSVPKDTPANQTVYLLIMPWRPGWWPGIEQQIPLKQVASGTLECTATLDEGSVVRYAYDRWDEGLGRGWRTTRESAGPEISIECRLLLVCSENAVVEDAVAAWSDRGQTLSAGTLKGTVVDEATGEPLPDTDITAGGIHIATRYDGTFEFPALAVGSQRVTACRSLGDHRMTDAVAEIRAGQTSLVTLAMQPAQPVDVTFEATLPEDTPADAEIRLMGSAYQMGARIGNLNSPQLSYISAPVMQREGDRATLSLSMYEGMYAQYWYTVSDAWYGCEKGANGDCFFRSLTVSTSNHLQSDQIGTWRGEYMTRLSVYLTVPDSTPLGTPVAVNFSWMTPIGHNRWVFHRYGYPGQSVSYMYLLGSYRAGQNEGAEPGNRLRAATFGDTDSNVEDVIPEWAHIPTDWLAKDALPPADFPDFHYTPPGSDFIRGFCLVDFWSAEFPALLGSTFDRMQSHNGEWVEVSNIWSYGKVMPLPTLESRPLYSGGAMPRQELIDEMRRAHEQGLSVLLTPQCNMEMTQGGVALGGQHTAVWWQAWLEEAEAFWMWNAQAAEEAGAEALLLPGYYFHAFPQKSDFESKSDARAFDQGIQSMIAKVRAVYHGKLVLGVTPTGFSFPSAVDWLGGTTFQTGKPDLLSTSSVEAWSEAYDNLFMRTLDPYYWTYQKPVVLYQVDIPSAASPGDPTGEQAQARQLQGLVSALSKRSWVVGMFSFGYMPIDAPSLPHDGVRGRLAEDVLAAYYQQ